MPFELKNEVIDGKSHKMLIVFKLDKDFTEDDFNKILTILDKLLERKEKFIFLINGLDIQSAPLKSGITLIKWMKSNKERIPNVLCGSGIVIKYPKLISVINFVFSKRPPVSPNILSTDLKKAYDFLKSI